MDKITTSMELALASNSTAPDWVQLFTYGEMRARDGRKFVLKKGEEAMVLASITTIGMDIAVDFDHQMDLADDNTQKPAAGWIDRLEARDDGIYGQVEWTERGRAAVTSREYRYLSPVFLHGAKTGEVGTLLRVALTNDPALHLKALTSNQEKSIMDKFLKALCAALGLGDETSQDDIVKAVAALNQKAGKEGDNTGGDAAKVVSAVCQQLDLGDDASADDIIKALTSVSASARGAEASADDPDPAKFVGIDQHKAVCAKLNALQDRLDSKDATAKVDAAIQSGQLIPAQRDWGLALCKKDPQAFDEFVADAPVVVDGKRRSPSGSKDGGSILTDEDKAICKQLGMSEKDFADARKVESEGGDN